MNVKMWLSTHKDTGRKAMVGYTSECQYFFYDDIDNKDSEMQDLYDNPHFAWDFLMIITSDTPTLDCEAESVYEALKQLSSLILRSLDSRN